MQKVYENLVKVQKWCGMVQEMSDDAWFHMGTFEGESRVWPSTEPRLSPLLVFSSTVLDMDSFTWMTGTLYPCASFSDAKEYLVHLNGTLKNHENEALEWSWPILTEANTQYSTTGKRTAIGLWSILLAWRNLISLSVSTKNVSSTYTLTATWVKWRNC